VREAGRKRTVGTEREGYTLGQNACTSSQVGSMNDGGIWAVVDPSLVREPTADSTGRHEGGPTLDVRFAAPLARKRSGCFRPGQFRP
jgi:hypothetical protein